MVNDLVSDCLTRIRNAQRAGHASVRVMFSSVTKGVLDVLQREGFVAGYDVRPVAGKKNRQEIEVVLKYYGPGDPMIRMVRRVSKPGRRVYSGSEDIGKTASGLGLKVISTSEGIVSDREARRRNIGGEVMALVA